MHVPEAKLDNFMVLVGNGTNEGELCYHHSGTSGHTFSITCTKPITGKYVTIRKLNEKENIVDMLELCEVNVFAKGMRFLFPLCFPSFY